MDGPLVSIEACAYFPHSECDHFFRFQDCLELLFSAILMHVAAVYVHKFALKN
jgi:hypothetical protein